MILFAAVDVEAAASRCADQSSADGRRAVSRQLGISIARPYTQPVPLEERFAERFLGGACHIHALSKWPRRGSPKARPRPAPPDQGHERVSGPLITTKLQLVTFLSIGCVSMVVLILIE